MFRLIAKIYAKLHYRWQQETSAANNDLSASLAVRTAEDHRTRAVFLTAEADAMDARITEVAELEEKGFWLCEDGHEKVACSCVGHGTGVHSPDCPTPAPTICETGKEMKLIMRDQMTGQEKYESDKQRNEAQTMAADRRTQAKAEEDAAKESDGVAKYFRDLAQKNRNVGDKVRAL